MTKFLHCALFPREMYWGNNAQYFFFLIRSPFCTHVIRFQKSIGFVFFENYDIKEYCQVTHIVICNRSMGKLFFIENSSLHISVDKYIKNYKKEWHILYRIISPKHFIDKFHYSYLTFYLELFQKINIQ